LDDLNRRKHELKIVLKKLVKLNKSIEDLDNEVDQLQEDDIKISAVLEQAIVSLFYYIYHSFLFFLNIIYYYIM
jgi:uncharacterized protein YlxW (UPF0749 family)